MEHFRITISLIYATARQKARPDPSYHLNPELVVPKPYRKRPDRHAIVNSSLQACGGHDQHSSI